jgi:uroporphyrinogen-III synthase
VCGKRLDDFVVVAFTSKRGVAGMESVWERLGKSGQVLAAVGEKTASALEEQVGRKVDLIAEPQTGEGLAKTVLAKFQNPVSVLYVQGKQTAGKFKSLLKKKGFYICDLVVYENYAPELEPLILNKPALAVFASPSAANNFFSINPLLRYSVSAIAIGPTTKKELRKIGVSRITLASKPDPDYLVECVLKIAQGGAGR